MPAGSRVIPGTMEFPCFRRGRGAIGGRSGRLDHEKGSPMRTPVVIVEGIVKPDGTLEVAEKVNLSAGKMEVTLFPLSEPPRTTHSGSGCRTSTHERADFTQLRRTPQAAIGWCRPDPRAASSPGIAPGRARDTRVSRGARPRHRRVSSRIPSRRRPGADRGPGGPASRARATGIEPLGHGRADGDRPGHDQ